MDFIKLVLSSSLVIMIFSAFNNRVTMFNSDRLLDALKGRTIVGVFDEKNSLTLVLNDGAKLVLACEWEKGLDGGLYNCAVLRRNGEKVWSD